MVSFLGNYGRIGGLATALAVVLVAWLLSAAMTGRPDRRRQLLAAVVLSSTAGALYLWAQQIGLDSVIWLEAGGDEPAHPPGLLGNSNFSGAHVASASDRQSGSPCIRLAGGESSGAYRRHVC